jgi:hypothetical protein
MLQRLAADALVVVHLAFVAFVVVGGFLAWGYPRIVWMHAPAATWGALIEFMNWTCPLTPLEKKLRIAAGEIGYESSFIEHYVIPILYPSGLTRSIQLGLGILVVLLNLVAYTVYFRRRRSSEVHK